MKYGQIKFIEASLKKKKKEKHWIQAEDWASHEPSLGIDQIYWDLIEKENIKSEPTTIISCLQSPIKEYIKLWETSLEENIRSKSAIGASHVCRIQETKTELMTGASHICQGRSNSWKPHQKKTPNLSYYLCSLVIGHSIWFTRANGIDRLIEYHKKILFSEKKEERKKTMKNTKFSFTLYFLETFPLQKIKLYCFHFLFLIDYSYNPHLLLKPINLHFFFGDIYSNLKHVLNLTKCIKNYPDNLEKVNGGT